MTVHLGLSALIEYYRDVPSEYVTELYGNVEYHYTVNDASDGDTVVSCGCYYDFSGLEHRMENSWWYMYGDPILSFGNSTVLAGCNYVEDYVEIIHTEDAHDYIYTIAYSDPDILIYYVYDCSDSLNLLSDVPHKGYGVWGVSSGIYNLRDFVIFDQLYLLGNVPCGRHYAVGSDGIPQALDDYYYYYLDIDDIDDIESSDIAWLTLTSVMDVPSVEVNAAGETLGTHTIAGRDAG